MAQSHRMSNRGISCFLRVIAVVIALLPMGCNRATNEPVPASTHGNDAPAAAQADDSEPSAKTAEQIAAERQKLDQEIWRKEVLAQKYEQFFISLWDRLRSSSTPESILRELPCETIHFGVIETAKALPHEIQQFEFSGPTNHVTRADWAGVVDQFVQRNFRLVETEWHHSEFALEQVDGTEKPVSTISFVLHLIRPLSEQEKSASARELLDSTAPQQRIVAKGELRVRWPTLDLQAVAKDGMPVVDATPIDIEVVKLNALARAGSVCFREVLELRRRDNEVASAHPLLVYDVDFDGFPEILLPRWNRIYRRDSDGRYREGRIVESRMQTAECGVIADITGDGRVDLVTVAAETDRPIVFAGQDDGSFDKSPREIANVSVPQALAVTAGDVDGDHDLDLWLTQYKPSYLGGQMPHPYDDANDGDPAYLLINDGAGNFKDGTVEFGLDAKRRRRTYSASFIDYDDDRDQDLVVVSDYAGVDLYENNGERFVDVTATQLPSEDLFGMAHTFGDFDFDGQLDAYFIGMSSTTARRLDRMGLDDARFERRQGARTSMGYGNRLMVRGESGYADAPFSPSVARTGWSWGTSNFDFDLDGDRDIYIANGFRSGQSCQDYCTTFWRHDIYTGAVSQGNDHAGLAALFTDLMTPLNTGATSWNGYEHNALMMNLDGHDFVNVGFLMGVAFEYDARCVVAADLDADGRPDLLVGRYRLIDGGYALDIKVYQNMLETTHDWIGVNLDPSRQPLGAKVSVTTEAGTHVARVVTGDSFLSQHPATVLFGLGKTVPKTLVVEWPDGSQSTIDQPTKNQYHQIR